MKNVAIVNIRTIEKNKSGEIINAVVIDLVNGTSVIRQLNQFKTDLTNSRQLAGVNLDNIQSVLHPVIQDALEPFIDGGKLMGDWGLVKAGEMYEDTNPASATYGKMLPYKVDHIRVNGFLTLRPSAEYQQMNLIAKATVAATLANKYAGAFGAAASALKAEDVADDEIPAEMQAELAAAAAAPVEEVAAPAKK